jgi:hypothetical protein
MSALTPKARIGHNCGNVCFVPRAEYAEAVANEGSQ